MDMSKFLVLAVILGAILAVTVTRPPQFYPATTAQADASERPPGEATEKSLSEPEGGEIAEPTRSCEEPEQVDIARQWDELRNRLADLEDREAELARQAIELQAEREQAATDLARIALEHQALDDDRGQIALEWQRIQDAAMSQKEEARRLGAWEKDLAERELEARKLSRLSLVALSTVGLLSLTLTGAAVAATVKGRK
jgi:hypothetical protein